MQTPTPPLVPTLGQPENSSQKKRRAGFRLFKRDDTGRTVQLDAPGYKDRPYYFAFEFLKKKYIRCTQFNDADKAQTRARQIYKQITEAIIRDDQKALDRTKLKQSSSALLSKVITIYDQCGVDAGANTRLQNIQGLKLIIRTVFDLSDDQDCTTLPIHSIVNETSARKWFEIQTKKAQALESQGAQLSTKRSANSRYAAARSMFVPKAIAAYKAAGIYHECMSAFAEAFNTFKFSKLPPSVYNAPSEEIITTTLESWLQLEDRNMFLAVGHALAFGLRKGELGQARWSWHTIRAGYPVLDSTVDGDDVHVKNNSALIQVRALDPFYSQMMDRVRANSWAGEKTSYILTGCDSNREDSVFRAVSEWLRNLGWNTKKTNHALRAYAGSQIAMKYSIYEASGWLRHSTVKVTENNYSYFIKRFKPADLNTLPARWATIEQEPQLRVLPAATA